MEDKEIDPKVLLFSAYKMDTMMIITPISKKKM